MTRRVLRVLVEIEGEAFDPDATNPYAESQAELEAVLTSNLQTITSMDAGDVITLRDTNGNRCGKVECEDFPGGSPLLPYWTRLSDLALEVEEEFPVSKFLEEANPLLTLDVEKDIDPTASWPEQYKIPTGSGQKTNNPEPTTSVNKETYDEEAARAFDEGEIKEPPYPGTPSSHEHIAVPDPGDPVIPSRPRTRKGGGVNVPPPPGDPSMK